MTDKRNFPNFIEGYLSYASDNFCPEQFHRWTAVSLISGMLERKVWVTQGLNTLYPNTYILLVSHPGSGKSTAIERGTELLHTMRTTTHPEFKIVPDQITESALLEYMKIRNSIQIGTTSVFYTSGYFCPDEASASALQNLYGDFNATITKFYDCPKVFAKKIKAEREITELINVSFCVLAGSTFDYLKNLINETSVMGGLASRFIYIMSDKKLVREPKWNEQQKLDEGLKAKLMEDLAVINKLQGRFTPTKGFIERWEKAIPEFDNYRNKLNSERLESINARKITNLMKVAMILSVSEGNSLELTERHWDEARDLIEGVVKHNPTVIKSAIIAQNDTQSGLNLHIIDEIEKAGGVLDSREIKKIIMRYGADVAKLGPTLDFMVQAGNLESITEQGKVSYKILTKVENNL